MDSSSFSDIQQTYPDAERLSVGGSTSDCYRVKLYGKFHFMKQLKPELRTDPRYVSAMQKEFETGYGLEHPHLVRYMLKGEGYLLTEYVDGENLQVFAASHPDYFRNRKNADRFLRQLLDVVGYLHQNRVIHLDLKPENILITRIGHDVKLTDLGYCYTDTYTDTMGRTDKYAAPELLNCSSQVDARTDIYAIGKILQTLPCFHIYNKMIARCTAEEPSRRYQTIEELHGDLQSSSHVVIIGIVVLLFLAIFWGGYYLIRQNGPNSEVQPQTIEQPNSPADSIIELPNDNQAPLPPSTTKKLEIRESAPSVKSEILSSTEQLKADIKAVVLPKFNATMGVLPDSVSPGSEQWAQAGWALEKELANTLKELILSHQDIPMETVAREYNSYVQSLITLKFNQNHSTP